MALTLTVLGHPLHAADFHWLGTWRLDRAHSQLVGTTIRIARIPTGYHFDFGAAAFDIGDDGRFYPTVSGRTTSLKAISDNKWRRIHRNNGREVDRSILTVSPDQQTLTIDTKAILPDGGEERSQDILQRVGDGRGLPGTWRSTKPGLDVAETITLTAL